jgi:hypothetical protein
VGEVDGEDDRGRVGRRAQNRRRLGDPRARDRRARAGRRRGPRKRVRALVGDAGDAGDGGAGERDEREERAHAARPVRADPVDPERLAEPDTVERKRDRERRRGRVRGVAQQLGADRDDAAGGGRRPKALAEEAAAVARIAAKGQRLGRPAGPKVRVIGEPDPNAVARRDGHVEAERLRVGRREARPVLPERVVLGRLGRGLDHAHLVAVRREEGGAVELKYCGSKSSHCTFKRWRQTIDTWYD